MISYNKTILLILFLFCFIHSGFSNNGTMPEETKPIINPDEVILEIVTQQAQGLYNCGFVELTCNIAGNEKVLKKTMPDSGGVIFTFNKNELDPTCEQINIKKITIFDHLFEEIFGDNEQFSITFGEKKTREFIINATNYNVYWERLDFSQNYNLANKKVLVIVGNDFDYLEYCMIPKYLEYFGAKITSTSNEINRLAHYWNVTEEGSYIKINTTAPVDIVVDSIDVSLYDCIFLPGGSGPANLLADYPQIRNIISTANENGLLLSAICHGPLLLAESNVIRGRQVTGFPDIAASIQAHGGIYVQGKVFVDGKIITGNWPHFNSVAKATAKNLENR